MLLYHYCSNDAFLKILSNRELWLSDLTLSNDSMEGAWVREVLLEECRRREVSPHIISAFADRFDRMHKTFSALGFCLSERGDLLSQWRGYADNGAGIAIGFDRKRLTEIARRTADGGIKIYKIIYNNKEQIKLLRKDIDALSAMARSGRSILQFVGRDHDEYIYDENGNILSGRLNQALDFFLITIMNSFYIVKNTAFVEEREHRLMFQAVKNDNGLLNSYPIDMLNYRSSGDKIVPYFSFKLGDKLNCISDIILGPRNKTPKSVIDAALSRFGLPNVDIRRSAATYR